MFFIYIFMLMFDFFFFFQAEDGIRDIGVTGVQTCALPISRPGSKRGVPVPGSVGPLGNTPTHSNPPASRAMYHVSPSDASDTPGASGFGDPNNTRRKSTASATAATPSPAATAKAPIGCVLNEPKKVMSSEVNV